MLLNLLCEFFPDELVETNTELKESECRTWKLIKYFIYLCTVSHEQRNYFESLLMFFCMLGV